MSLIGTLEDVRIADVLRVLSAGKSWACWSAKK